MVGRPLNHCATVTIVHINSLRATVWPRALLLHHMHQYCTTAAAAVHPQGHGLITTAFATLTLEATRMNVTSGLVIAAWNSKPLLTTTLTARHEHGSNSTSSAVSLSGPMIGSFCHQIKVFWNVTKRKPAPLLAYRPTTQKREREESTIRSPRYATQSVNALATVNALARPKYGYLK